MGLIISIDDRKEVTKLTIERGGKIILNKSGKTIKDLLRFVYDGTKKESVKLAILDAIKAYNFMKGSVTKINIKD